MINYVNNLVIQYIYIYPCYSLIADGRALRIVLYSFWHIPRAYQWNKLPFQEANARIVLPLFKRVKNCTFFFP